MCNAHCAMCIQADLPLNNMWTSCKVGQSTVLHPFNCPKLSIGDIVHSLHITIKEHLRDMMEKGRLKKKLWDFMAIFLCSGRGVFSIPYLCRVYGSIKTVQKRLGEDQCSILHCVQQRMQRTWHTMHSASGTQCTAECEMREAQGWAAAASRGQPCITSLHHADDNLIMMMRDLDDNFALHWFDDHAGWRLKVDALRHPCCRWHSAFSFDTLPLSLGRWVGRVSNYDEADNSMSLFALFRSHGAPLSLS